MALAFSMLGMMYVVSDLVPMLPPSILPEPWHRELAFSAVTFAAIIFNGCVLIGLLRLCVAYTRLLNQDPDAMSSKDNFDEPSRPH
jgi:hypothetical protein